MLSAALDMVSDAKLGAGIVLLADIAPSLLVQIVAPWFMHTIPYSVRISAVVVIDIISFLIPAFGEPVWLKLIGVVFASIGSGFGEITFLAYSSHYHKNTVSTWSSGTGGAGILGSLSYLALRYYLSTKWTLIVSSWLPLGIAFSYFFLMTKSKKSKDGPLIQSADEQLIGKDSAENVPSKETHAKLDNKTKVHLMVKLLPFMIPLATVYFSEYLINQGVDPALNYENEKLIPNSDKQYMYYQLIYQTGVFISRSSVNFFPIKRLWIPAVCQATNLTLLTFVAVFNIIPYIWIVFFIIFWEGLLGGCIYVNTYYGISETFSGSEKEFCLGATSQSYGLSITLAALTAIGWEPLLKGLRKNHQIHW